MFNTHLSTMISNYKKMWTYIDDYYEKHGVNMSYAKKVEYFSSVYKGETFQYLNIVTYQQIVV